MLEKPETSKEMQEQASAGEAVESASGTVLQHVIDPELCVYCLACYGVCESSAIVDGRGILAIDAEKCNDCRDCVAECDTGAIENWLSVPAGKYYTVDEQFEWDSLPQQSDS